jgi:Asp-tRNA(Asn)/Glu-tRNA(Gln) amidotransferase C subunit
MCNGSHRPAESKGKQKRTEDKETRQCGSALSAEPELKKAVTKLCSVKKINVGKVTARLDAIFVTNSTRADERRESKKAEEMAKETRRMQKKGVKFNKNMEETLAASIGDLTAHLKAMDNAVGVSKDYLKRQFNARLMRAELDGFKYPSIGNEFRVPR